MSQALPTVLLTGATGFLGRRLLKRFAASGHPVVAVVRDRTKLKDPPTGDIRIIEADLTHAVTPPPGMNVDLLVHAAALIDYDAGVEALTRTNVHGTRHAAALALALGATRGVLVSSLAVLGPRPLGDPGMSEDGTPAPDTDYGRSKLEAEGVFREAFDAVGKEAVVLRPGNLLGDGEPGILAPLFAAASGADPAMLIAEWNAHHWQPLHVLDAVEAVVCAVRFGGAGTYVLTDGTIPAVGDLVRHVAWALRNFGLTPPMPPRTLGASRDAESIHYAYLPKRATEVWNWAATRTFPQTVIEVARSQGLVRKHPGVFTVDGPLKTVLLNTPVEGMKLSRDMGGGLGFVHDSEDRFQPLDLLWLAARLEAVGWPVEVIDGNLMTFTVGELLYYLARTDVDVLVAEVNLPTFESDLAFLRTVKEASRLRVVAKTVLSTGGFAERLLLEAGVDIVLLGECDLTIERILAGSDARGTARLVDGVPVFTAEEKLEDLDQLPIPARHLTPFSGYAYSLLPREGFTTIQTSRGCPYSCGYYCPYPMTQGKAWRARSATHVLAEIEACVAAGYRHFLMRDATFTLDRKRTLEICRGISSRRLPITFWCETRINCLDAEVLDAMAHAGCKGINFGLESGDDDVLKSGAKAGVDVKKIRSILAETDRHGIVSHLLVVVGLPQETRKSIFETYTLLGELPARTLGVTGITPFPGTALWNDAEKRGWVKSKDWSLYGGNHSVMTTDHLSRDDIRFAAGMLYEYFGLTRPGAAPIDHVEAHRERMRRWVEHGIEAPLSV